VGRRQFIDQHTYLPDQILALTDRMSMANSLEVRVPFMDFRLVRHAQRIPGEGKQTALDYKIVLKRALGHRLPATVLARPKWGFDTPLSRWVRLPEVFSVLQHLTSGLLVKERLATKESLCRLVASPAQAALHARRVWSLFVLEVWLRLRGVPAPPRESLGEMLTAPV